MVNRKIISDVSSRPRVLLYDITKALVLEEQARSLIGIYMSSFFARDHRLNIIVEERDKFVSLSCVLVSLAHFTFQHMSISTKSTNNLMYFSFALKRIC